jgi:LmbE family N-acetylglucosaminyl deacetylase
VAEVVLSLMAHPDDAEFLCAGTLLRLGGEHGWQVHLASMTPGDCGSLDRDAEEISRVRRVEAAQSAALAGARYHCLEERDFRIFYDARTLEQVTRLVREVRPRILITHSPADYMVDHEQTSVLVRAAAFAAPAPNYLRGSSAAPPLDHIPYLYYCDPIEGKDALGQRCPASFCVDISGVIDQKAAMLAQHASQREWLRKHHGVDQYLMAMRNWSRQRGQESGVACAEGFRQHLGHGYPQDNLLGRLLGSTA